MQAALEFAPVVQLGQRVVAGLEAQHLVQLPLLGDVDRHHQQLVGAVQNHLGDGHVGPEPVTLLIAQLGAEAVEIALVRLPHVGIQARVLEQVRQPPLTHVFAKPLAGRAVGIGDGAVMPVGQQDQRRQQIVQRAKALFALAVATGHVPRQGNRPLAGAGDGEHQHRQQDAGQHADRQRRVAQVETGPGGHPRLQVQAPHPPAIGKPAVEVLVAIDLRRRGRIEQQLLPGIGDVDDAHAEHLRDVLRNRIADQAADAKRHRQRSHLAPTPLRHRCGRRPGAEYRHAQGDAVVARQRARLLRQPERGRQGGQVGITRGDHALQVVRLRVDIQPGQGGIARQRLHPGGEVVNAIRPCLFTRIVERLQRREAAARLQVGVDVGELLLADLVGGKEQALHRAQQAFRRMQLRYQCDRALVDQGAAGELQRGLLPLDLLVTQQHRQRQAQHQRQHAPPVSGGSPRPRRGHTPLRAEDCGVRQCWSSGAFGCAQDVSHG